MDRFDADAAAANARLARREAMEELVRQHGLTFGEAAQLVDAGGPLCSRCGERVSGDVAAHVAMHTGGQ